MLEFPHGKTVFAPILLGSIIADIPYCEIHLEDLGKWRPISPNLSQKFHAFFPSISLKE